MPEKLFGQPLPVPAGMTRASSPGLPPNDQTATALWALYERPTEEGWIAGGPVAVRNAICTSLWEQQWPRLRRDFAFCSGAIEPRRLPDRTFDLLAAPPGSHPVTAAQTSETPVVRALLEDLAVPGSLRQYLWQVGADSSRRRVMKLLVETYLAALHGLEDPSGVLSIVARQAPRPTSMRRLKRSLLSARNGLLSAVPATEMLACMMSPSFAGHVLASDSDLERWAEAAWQREPDQVLKGLSAVTQPNRPRKGLTRSDDQSRPTLGEAAADILVRVIANQASPDHLFLIARSDPTIATALIRSEDAEQWWGAWARLPQAQFSAVLDAGLLDPPTRAAVQHAVAAVVGSKGGEFRWPLIREAAGVRAVSALLTVAASGGGDEGAWTRALSERPDLLATALASPRSSAELAIAADAAPTIRFVFDLGFEAWQPLARSQKLWTGSARRAAVIYAASLEGDGQGADQSLAIAYDSLYKEWTSRPDGSAWDLLAPILPSKHDDWDHCRRLARRTARDIKKSERFQVLKMLQPGRSRDALRAELEGHKPRDGGSEKPVQSSGNPIEALLKLMRPW
jgi:hypothetical protein